MIYITDKTKCCGCTACVNICPKKCIDMIEDEEGFLYPKVHKNYCVHCGACIRVCPILNHPNQDINPKQQAFLVQYLNNNVCQESTSGGAFTAIADYTINHDGIVFGVEMQSDYVVRHSATGIKEELVKFRNSKYVQSSLGDTYCKVKHHLDKNRLVCFSGTPCQVEGLLNFLNKEYKNLILIDVVCRAVPSPGIWKKYINMVSLKYGQIKSIRFRDKFWGYQYSTMEIKAKNGTVYREGIESQQWLRMFFSGMIIRPSCTDCQFRGRYRHSDFTIWDCFNSYDYDKSFNEKLGTSRVLVHNSKGSEIFELIKKEFKYKKISAEMAIRGNKEMVTSPTRHPNAPQFFKDAQVMNMEDLLNKYFPNTFKIKCKVLIRRFLNLIGVDIVIKRLINKIKQ